MTLSDIASLVCDKVGKTDAASLALCKKFVARRYVMIHDSELWTESLAMASISTSYSQVTVPLGISRVLAVRASGSNNLYPSNPSLLYSASASAFEDAGTPTQFLHLSPTAFHWSAIIDTFGLTEPAAAAVYVAGTDAADTGKHVILHGDPLLGEVDEQITLNSTLIVGATNSWTMPLRFSKDATAGDVVVFFSVYQETFQAAETSLSHCRVQIIPAPTESTDYLILGKRRPRILARDTDTPDLTGCDDALVAFTQADMLERLRHYSKAAMKQQEGAAQLAKMRDLDRNQQANIPRIIPVVDCYEGYNSINTI